MATATETQVGESIPANTAHAVSVSLPTWRANVGYEEGEEWVLSKMKTGYPRFFIHKAIQSFEADVVKSHGRIGERALLVPTRRIADRCVAFFNSQLPRLGLHQVRILEFVLNPKQACSAEQRQANPTICAVMHPGEHFGVAKTFWQHSGDGVSSRRAEYCHHLFTQGLLVLKDKVDNDAIFCKGPRRYRNSVSGPAPVITPPQDDGANSTHTPEARDQSRFLEERFGRNLDFSMAAAAKLAIRRRIAGSLLADVDLRDTLQASPDTDTVRQVEGFSVEDVYLFPTGMSSIFNTHQGLLAARGELKSIMFGFPYIDTLKILEKFGPGCVFYGHGTSADLDDLEARLQGGERFLALFCEFPGNPLLNSPDLARIRKLADQYDFAIVVDETIGNFLNVHVLPLADVIVSSLTKVFSGDSNVMGGSAILNPKGRYYRSLRETWTSTYEDNLWPEDALFLERNSRDFESRIARINANAEAICEVLRQHPKVKQVNYPKYSQTRPFYDHCRTPNGGYGGLLSATFHARENAAIFFDNLKTVKGPSLGTNFTLSSPYVILAHYGELDWAASFGVEADLIRFSVGLEDTKDLVAIFNEALAALPAVD